MKTYEKGYEKTRIIVAILTEKKSIYFQWILSFNHLKKIKNASGHHEFLIIFYNHLKF